MFIINSFVLWIKSAISHSYVICSLVNWVKAALGLAFNNDFLAAFMSIFAVLSIKAAELMITDKTFGTTRIVIVLVLITVFFNTIYGVKKSLIKERILFAKATKFEYGTSQYNNFLRRSQRYRFNWKKLQFVFFKCFTLLGYLYFVTKLLEDGGSFFDFSAEILAKAPIAIFWYYEFKSIGENSEFVYGKKASIFKIVEMLFEPRIFKFFGRNTPTDGVHDETEDTQLDPKDYGFKEDDFNKNSEL